MQSSEKRIRTLTGTVVSDKMNKGIVVRVDRQVKHSYYRKYINRSSKIHVHDTQNQSQIGDIVKIKECSPISKTKSWTLVEIIKKAV